MMTADNGEPEQSWYSSLKYLLPQSRNSRCMRAEKAVAIISTHTDEHLMLKRSKRIYLESYKFFTLYAQN